MSDESQEEPKLIIDEDWKSQVQKEKEAAATKADIDQLQVADGKESDIKDVGEQSDAPAAEFPLPPASFEFLVTTLATQAMMALGQLPGPDGKTEKAQKPVAKHYIDLLGILEEKTKGNLEATEAKLLSDLLHNMRMAFVQA
jgi:hypothetical protein